MQNTTFQPLLSEGEDEGEGLLFLITAKKQPSQ
jgi:hypothetical protein